MAWTLPLPFISFLAGLAIAMQGNLAELARAAMVLAFPVVL